MDRTAIALANRLDLMLRFAISSATPTDLCSSSIVKIISRLWLVILEGSPFARKIYKLLFKDHRPHVHLISKFFNCSFLQNSQKCLKLTDAKALPGKLEDIVPRKDRYLFEIRESLPQAVIVTTDKSLESLPGVISRDDFLRKYNELPGAASKDG